MPRAIRRSLLASVITILALVAPAVSGAATVRNYDLGRVDIPDPSPRGPLPAKLWGAIGVPGGAGPHPLVVVVHGRHGDNCPKVAGQEIGFDWPCFSREQRNDLGLRHVVAALASRGVAAIAPDLNGAYTFGWGPENEFPRWRRIVDRTITRLFFEIEDGGSSFGLNLKGRIDLSNLGLLGHSRSGYNAVRLARIRERRSESPVSAMGGQAVFDAIFLLAPVHEGLGLPDAPTAVIAAGCDGDVPGEARRYLEGARRQKGRSTPVFQIKLAGANHNYFNSTLSALGRDDGKFTPLRNCSKPERLKAGAQQGWIDKAVASFFDATLDGATKPAWMRASEPDAERLYRLPVTLDRLFP